MNHYEPSDYYVANNAIYVIVRDTKASREYVVEGRIGIDNVVEPMKVSPSNEGDTEAIAALAETYVETETPYRIFDGSGARWYYTKTLRGLTFSQRHNIDRLDNDDLQYLAEIAGRLADGEDITVE